MDDRRCTPHSRSRKTQVSIRHIRYPPDPRRRSRARLPTRWATHLHLLRKPASLYPLNISSPSTPLSPKLPYAPSHSRSFNSNRHLALRPRSASSRIWNSPRHRRLLPDSLSAKKIIHPLSTRADRCGRWPRLILWNSRRNRLSFRDGISLVLPRRSDS